MTRLLISNTSRVPTKISVSMYASLILPWSSTPSASEAAYRAASLQKTKGSLFIQPPSESTMRSTFNTPPRAKTRMSAGAVALCKHYERNGASSEHGRVHPFWTLPKGSNEQKTATAEKILEDMLANAKWRNVMFLHAGVAVYEIRNGEGFGMRWTLDLEEVGRQEEDGPQSDPDKTERRETAIDDANSRDWRIVRTNFRGFLEPIEGLDHELPPS